MIHSLVEFFTETTKKVPDEYIEYILCKEFGWTYQELMSQPADFVERLLLIRNIERKYARSNKGDNYN